MASAAMQELQLQVARLVYNWEAGQPRAALADLAASALQARKAFHFRLPLRHDSGREHQAAAEED